MSKTSRRDRSMFWLWGNRNPVCPYCESEELDAWEYNIGNGETIDTQCGNCEKHFEIQRIVNITYSTKGICSKNGTMPHKLYKPHESGPYICQNCFVEFYDFHLPSGEYPHLKEGEFIILNREEVEKEFPL